MADMFNGMFGKVAKGCCRMSTNGKIAIKTSGGYKTYNTKTGRLTNCANFVFDIGEDMFFVMPTNKVKVGDIILVNGTPRCVIKADSNEIVALNYENSTKETIIPERHVFMGKHYMYGKIVSLMGNMAKGNGLMKYMIMKEIFKGTDGNIATNSSNGFEGMFNGMNPMMAYMMFNGGGDHMFNGMFDFDEDMDDLFNFTDDENDDEEDE